MSLLRQKRSTAEIPLYTGLQVQTSSSAVPIQIVYGVSRISPNLIWNGGFTWVAQKQKAGKGGGGAISGYEYFDGVILALCEGPINAIGGIWSGQSVTYMWNLNLGPFYGYQGQSPWSYIYSIGYGGYASQALGYTGTAYLASGYFDLGSSATMPAISVEVHGLLVGTGLINEWDASPALCIYDILTAPRYGVHFPAGSIESSTLLGASGGNSVQAYCVAAYLAFSPVISNQETAASIIGRWLKLINCEAVWSGGKLKFLSYGDSALNWNGNTFNPNVTPIYSLTDDDFVADSGVDPVEVQRSDPYAAKNLVTIEMLNRWNSYAATPIEARDQNAIEKYGLNIDATVTAHEFCEFGCAGVSANLILQRNLYVRNAYTFKLSSIEYCLLDPMDIVEISDPGLGMVNVPVRITSIEEDDSGILTVTAEDFLGGNATAVSYPLQTTSTSALDRGVVPAKVNAPIIFEPPSSLTGGSAEVWVAVSGGVPSAFSVIEDSSIGQHFVQLNGPSEASGTIVEFSISVKPSGRTFCSLQIYNGSVYAGGVFDLTAGTASPFSGATGSIIALANGWWQITVSTTMTSAAAPLLRLDLRSDASTVSYAGTVGDGLIVWGAKYQGAAGELSFLSGSPILTGVTFSSSSATTPEGSSGAVDHYWGGAFVWLSTDGSTYSQIGTIKGPSRQGVLTAALAAGLNPDTTNALSVDLTESGGTLASGSLLDAQSGVTLCLVDGELLAYQTATQTGLNAYNLTYLIRGLYGSAIAAHSSGAPFVYLDSAIFKYALPAAFIGVPIYLKFQSFNIFGNAAQDLSTCVAYSYTLTGVGDRGPVATALSLGQNMDFGAASDPINEADDFGLASGAASVTIDLGLASA